MKGGVQVEPFGSRLKDTLILVLRSSTFSMVGDDSMHISRPSSADVELQPYSRIYPTRHGF